LTAFLEFQRSLNHNAAEWLRGGSARHTCFV
jgi:hypothetical protein